jgi:pimeloyl-ACP methyl ester carboxylesterase
MSITITIIHCVFFTQKARIIAILVSLALIINTRIAYAQKAIDTSGYISIGGIDQYISIKGMNSTKPLFLFLHGGPGGSVMSYAEKFTKKLQENFVVVQWDQRQTGKTLARNPSPDPLSFMLFQHDTRELVDSLLKRFHQPKLFLAGHSWGTALGFKLAKNNPELLYAYIAIGPMVNQLESERIVLELMRKKSTDDSTKSAELSTVNIPFENGEQLFYHRKWLMDFNGSKSTLSKEYVMTWADTWLDVFNEASKENLMVSTPKLDCPIYFFLGRKDFQTNAKIAEAYYHQLIAPKKNIFWFERSAHSIPNSEPVLLQEIIITKILPDVLKK